MAAALEVGRQGLGMLPLDGGELGEERGDLEISMLLHLCGKLHVAFRCLDLHGVGASEKVGGAGNRRLRGHSAKPRARSAGDLRAWPISGWYGLRRPA